MTASPAALGASCKAAELLGIAALLPTRTAGLLDVHDLLLRGLPLSVLAHFLKQLVVIQKSDFLEGAIGMSVRTYRRRKDEPNNLLSPEQSGRLWRFADSLRRATEVFGSQVEAELWLGRPAIGLDRRRPIELLMTPVGTDLVKQHLTRLEYGVYA